MGKLIAGFSIGFIILTLVGVYFLNSQKSIINEQYPTYSTYSN